MFIVVAGGAGSAARGETQSIALSITPLPDGSFGLSFPSVTGVFYTIEHRPNLGVESPWQNLSEFDQVPGTGETMTHVDTDAAAPAVTRRYYRLRIEPDTGPTEYILALYEFTETNPVPQVVASGITATDFDISSGSLNYGHFHADTWTGSGVPYAQGNSGWDILNVENAKYFTYTITADENMVFSVTNLRFLARASTHGPSAIGVFLNGALVHEQDMPVDETLSIIIPVFGQNNLTQAVIRIPGWDNDSRETGGGGHFRIDDVQAEGTVGIQPEQVPPTVTDPVFFNISDTSATLGGTVSDDGYATVTERGVFWSITPGFDPPSEGTKVSETGEFSPESFTLNVTGLPSDTNIYFRAFATNSAGMGLSEETSFKTTDEPALALPVVTEPTALDITETTAWLGGTIEDDGGGILVERGVYWSTSADFEPPEEGNKVYVTGEFDLGAFSVYVSGLPSDTEIFFRAFAANAEQTGYTDLDSFVTPADDDLVLYTFTGYTANPEAHRESIAPTSLDISAGSYEFGWSASDASQWESLGGTEPYVEGRGGGYWNANNQSDARYFHFTLTADSGWMMTVTGVSYLAYASRQGPSAVGVSLNGDPVHAENMPQDTVIQVEAPVAGYEDLSTAEIRIQGWDNGSRNTTGRGAYRIDTVRVHGFMTMDPNIGVPTVTNPSVSGVQSFSATLGGTITDDGGATVTERGVYWSTVENFSPPAQGTKVSEAGTFGIGDFTLNVHQLPPDTPIYFRAFAKSVAGAGFTEQASFTTEPYDAELLSLYEFTDQVVTPHARHPHIVSSHFVHNTGRPGFGSHNEATWTGSGVPYAQMAGNLARTSPTNARHFVYSLEAPWGTTFDISHIRFLARATDQGPSALSVSIDGDIIHTQNMPANETLSVSVPVTGYTDIELATIRILGWDNGTRETAGTGLMQIDDVRTEGSVSGTVSEPVTEGRHVRVASYNIEDGIGQIGSANYTALTSVLVRLDADIIAFQEVYASEYDDWVALAAALGYDHTALAPEGDISGTQRTAYYSRFPIDSVHAVLSPPGASEMTRAVLRVVIDVPDAENPLVIWNAHKKAMGGELNHFRRAVETLRIVQDIETYRAANTAHVEFVVLGDMNADVYTEDQSVLFTEDWYEDNESDLPQSFVLGEDIDFPVYYYRFPDDRYEHVTGGLHRPVVRQQDRNSVYSFENPSFISRLDYVLVSDALAARAPAGEIYYSGHDGTYAGLPKAGDPLPAVTSWTASDHLPIIIDLYMSAAAGPTERGEFSVEEELIGKEDKEEPDAFVVLSQTWTGDDESREEDTKSDSDDLTGIITLEEVALVTRLEIVPLSGGRFALRFPSEIGFTYTLEARNGYGRDAAWNVLDGFQAIPGTGGTMSHVDKPSPDGGIRFYRVRISRDGIR